MDIKLFQEKVSEAKRAAKKRNFKQTIDLIITLKELNLKNPAEQVEFFGHLNHPLSKKGKLCALVGPELRPKAEGVFDTIVNESEFETYKADPKRVKLMAKQHSFFVAQSNLMPKVAAAFGKLLGPKGKMPNPKAGCVVDLKADLKSVYQNLQKTVKVSAKTQPQVQVAVGTEDMDEAQVAENAFTIYDQLIHKLPKGEHNVSKVLIKLTMGPPVEVK